MKNTTLLIALSVLAILSHIFYDEFKVQLLSIIETICLIWISTIALELNKGINNIQKEVEHLRQIIMNIMKDKNNK